jgi:AcrR family transcriptional regulator
MLHTEPMTDRKNTIRAAVAAHLLETGLTGLGIRALAKAADTSDRMLIYYFGSKDELLRESLMLVVEGLSEQLDQELGSERQRSAELLEKLTVLCQRPDWRPMTSLWFEIVGLAARGSAPFQPVACEIADAFIDWIALHLVDVERHQAADVFAHLEGRMLLAVIGR